MGAIKLLIRFLKYPLEVKTWVQFYFYYRQHQRNSAWKEYPNSGWDRQSMRTCWELFDMSDKGSSMLVKQLDGDLARVITLFYIALRALDTIEDDMTIPNAIKQPILRSFYIHTVTPGWKFDGCGPNEKHRQYLVKYDNVVEEINLLSPAYRNIIIDTVQRTGAGMADYSHKAAINASFHIETVAEYDQYCRYAGGITMQAFSQILSTSGEESLLIGNQLELSNSVGLFMQKSDIIHDYREDVDQKRYFWPHEFWGQEESGFRELMDMNNTDPDTLRHATYVQSAMILDALQHVTDALDYLPLLKTQSVFHLCAILVVRALANLEFCFMNKEALQRKINMRKAHIVKLIMRCTNMREVALIFREYGRKIQAKAVRSDPSFSGISIACGKIEKYCEPYCVENLSTTKNVEEQLIMYASAILMLIFVFSFYHTEVH